MVDTLRPDSTMQGVPYMRTDPEGAFVSKDDYDALQVKHDNLAWNLDGCMESINNLSAQKDALAAELAEANAGRDKLITRDVESAMRIRALEAAPSGIDFLQTWMRTPNPQLGGAVPLDMLYQGYGRRLAQFIDSAYEANSAPETFAEPSSTAPGSGKTGL